VKVYPVGVFVITALGLGGCGKAFDDARKAALKSEGDILLEDLRRHAKAYVAERGELPKGTVGPSPAKACCPARCEPSPAPWNEPLWKAFDFQVTGPSTFQYSYTSDGKTFTATAVGDPDCAGAPVTIELTGSIVGGDLVTKVAKH